MSDHLSAALELADRGFHIHPVYQPGRIKPDGDRAKGKEPIPAGWTKAEPRTAAQLRGWWETDPATNIGIRTGRRRGGFFAVLDVDVDRGGEASLAELAGSHGLPRTPAVRTGGGGQHLYFATGRELASVDRLPGLPGLELKAAKRQVVAPPSLHASGQRYAWHPDDNLDTLPLAPLPGWLAALVVRPARSERPAGGGEGDFLREIAPPSYVADLAGLQVGADGKCRCPLPDHEDSHPSFHAYPTAERGWYCFGCGRGGDIFTLAAHLARRPVPARGADFLAVQGALLSFYERALVIQ